MGTTLKHGRMALESKEFLRQEKEDDTEKMGTDKVTEEKGSAATKKLLKKELNLFQGQAQ